MIEWKEDIVIPVNIEKVWDLFKDKNIKRIMPKVEEHILVEKTEEEAGARHRQTYREGKRTETYIVETLVYEDAENEKRKRIQFVLGKAFEISLSFTLEKLNEGQTRFTYEGHNKGVNFVGRAMLKLGGQTSNKQVVQEFLKKVEEEALKG
jgi:hypothetical protein